ncbi:sensor histidine kinase [Pseudonocardia nigra]|uniref:sensor histidine kinase n=1 Tax=Pseudonocardia nigra TaxID=1921578 RepID=UPI0027E23FE7|nr:ATP-binding protein [Pseudonocardia nigra]
MTVDLNRPVRRRPLRNRLSSDAGGRWPLARVFAVGASIGALLAVVAVTLGGIAMWRVGQSRAALVDVASPALLSAQQLSVSLLDQETGVRGYNLTGRTEFQDPYRDGLAAQRSTTATLRTLAERRGLEEIGPELDEVERAAQAWRTVYAEPVLAGAPGAPEPARGRALFDEVRAATRALVADLEAQRAAARDRVERASAFLIGIGIAIAAVLAAFLVAAALGLRRYVLRPVSALAGQVRHVVSGDVQQPVQAGGPREIVELGEDVEAMRRHILRDLDDAQAVNRRLDEQARELERSNRDLEQFAYVASHDLQEPLRKVSSFCQLLQRRYSGKLDDRADQYIEFAVDGAQRMQRLINDLLAFSRVGRTTEGFDPVDLGAVAAAAVKQLETVRDETGGKIVVDELPVVVGDRSLLHQLVLNLVGNGLKFHRDGVPPVVHVAAERLGDTWEITVTDNGIGIEPEYADKVFVIFQRLHGRDVYPGTGIGLALAKKIVEFHGGRIVIAASDGPGTTIRFTLPVPAEES